MKRQKTQFDETKQASKPDMAWMLELSGCEFELCKNRYAT